MKALFENANKNDILCFLREIKLHYTQNNKHKQDQYHII